MLPNKQSRPWQGMGVAWQHGWAWHVLLLFKQCFKNDAAHQFKLMSMVLKLVCIQISPTTLLPQASVFLFVAGHGQVPCARTLAGTNVPKGIVTFFFLPLASLPFPP